MALYKIIRHYRDSDVPNRTIATGLTLEEAQAHCQNPETSSSTCTGKVGKARTRKLGAWFDGYSEIIEKPRRYRRTNRALSLARAKYWSF